MSAETCEVAGCQRPRKGRRGMCGMHIERVRTHGTTDDPRPSFLDRFWGKVEKTDTCWLWVGGRGTHGYGVIRYRDAMWLAHRVSYTINVGPIPESLQIDHLCRVPQCVNPDHLEPVTPRTNTLRGYSPSAIAVRTNRCHRGHEFTPENTTLVPKGRQCKACVRLRRQGTAA